MRILGHIHTFNDEEVIDQSLQALLDQTYPVDEILVVDNDSTDKTLSREFPDKVKIIRHGKNLGTSGAVISGMKYALEHQFDWIWIFDADSAPRKDALEKLVEFYQGLSRDLQTQIWLLASLRVEAATQRKSSYELIFTPGGHQLVDHDQGQSFYEFDGTIWSASLYKLSAVQKLGLPSADYVLDWGEYEYGYLGKRRGYRAFLHQDSIVEHNIGGQAALHFTTYRLGPKSFRMPELPPIRCYYLIRNLLYFYLHEYHICNCGTLFPRFVNISRITLSFLLRPRNRWKQSTACLRGIWDGLFKNMRNRYE